MTFPRGYPRGSRVFDTVYTDEFTALAQTPNAPLRSTLLVGVTITSCVLSISERKTQVTSLVFIDGREKPLVRFLISIKSSKVVLKLSSHTVSNHTYVSSCHYLIVMYTCFVSNREFLFLLLSFDVRFIFYFLAGSFIAGN